jgi:mRNA interferase MazF
MLTSGDVLDIDLGVPAGSEAGPRRPAVVVTAQRVLAAEPTVIQVVPLTRTLHGYATEVTVTADEANGLEADSAAQCQHVRAVATVRAPDAGQRRPPRPAQVRDTLGALLDV